jgi:hypothetical protein
MEKPSHACAIIVPSSIRHPDARVQYVGVQNPAYCMRVLRLQKGSHVWEQIIKFAERLSGRVRALKLEAASSQIVNGTLRMCATTVR